MFSLNSVVVTQPPVAAWKARNDSGQVLLQHGSVRRAGRRFQCQALGNKDDAEDGPVDGWLLLKSIHDAWWWLTMPD